MYVIFAIDNATDIPVRILRDSLEEAQEMYHGVMEGQVHDAMICEVKEDFRESTF